MAAATTTAVNAVRQEMNERFAQVDQRFNQVDQKFAQVDQRFAQVDQKFDHLEQKLDRKTDRVFWWTISLLTALCMALYFKH